jgi:hypothetical protein
MADSKEIEQKPTSEVIADEQVSVSLIFRNVPEEKRAKLEQLAKDLGKKYRKLVNYIEK